MRSKILFLVIMLFAFNAQAAIVSPDYTFVANDQYSGDFYTRLNRDIVQLTNGINNITSAQVTNDTLTESTMADEINPRVRTYEGAACEYVYTGLLPVTSGTLSTTISAGTAYPKGYRINKAGTTNKTFASNAWTFVDIDQNGDFQYSAVAVGASTPAVATNSIRLARVSTDSGYVDSVTDLRRTSCANGPFDVISDAAGEANLDEMFSRGSPVRQRFQGEAVPQGFAQGAFVSFDTTTQFTVAPGSLYINGKYRTNSATVTVPSTADDPLNGISGAVTTVGASATNNVYAVADQDSVKTFSISYGAAPTGLTNYRKIGSIKTDINSHFTSSDFFTVHALNDTETLGARIRFDGSGTVAIVDSYNVSALTDNGTGDYTVTFSTSFATANYTAIAIPADLASGTDSQTARTVTFATGSIRFLVYGAADSTPADCDNINVLVFGKQ